MRPINSLITFPGGINDMYKVQRGEYRRNADDKQIRRLNVVIYLTCNNTQYNAGDIC